MSETSPNYGSGSLPEIDLHIPMPPVQPTRGPRPAAPELTIREPELRRLQGAVEQIASAERQVRYGLTGERPRLCHMGLDTIRTELVSLADVIRCARPADPRPDLTEEYLARIVDDLAYVEAVATEREETAAERHVARARAHLNATILALRSLGGVL
jgi:hypothetical protein